MTWRKNEAHNEQFYRWHLVRTLRSLFFTFLLAFASLAFCTRPALGRARSPNPFPKSRARSPFYFLDVRLTRTHLTAHDLSNTLPIISSHKRRRSASLFRLRWARRSRALNSHLSLSMAWHGNHDDTHHAPRMPSTNV